MRSQHDKNSNIANLTRSSSVLLLVTVSVLCFACLVPSDPPTSQISVANSAVRPSGYNGDLQGTVESLGDSVLYESDNIEETIEKTKLAKLTLSFAASGNTDARTIEVPEKAMAALSTFFRTQLRYYFIENLNGPKHSSGNYDYERAVFVNFDKAVLAVGDVEIDAPDGRRKVSRREAEKLAGRVVIETVNLWKAAKAK